MAVAAAAATAFFMAVLDKKGDANKAADGGQPMDRGGVAVGVKALVRGERESGEI